MDKAAVVSIGTYIHTCVYMLSCFNRVQLFVTPWTVACQAPLSMGFFRQEYWNRLPCPSPGNLPNPGSESSEPLNSMKFVEIKSANIY